MFVYCKFQQVLCLFVLILPAFDAAGLQWIADNVMYTPSTLHNTGSTKWSSTVEVRSNGPIYDKDIDGHFRLNVSAQAGNFYYFGVSDCIDINATPTQANTKINSMYFSKFGKFLNNDQLVDYNYDVTFRELLAVSTRIVHNSSSTRSQTYFKMAFVGGSTLSSLDLSVSTVGCLAARTIGDWANPLRWSLGRIPVATDAVTFPLGSGVATISSDVTVSSLSMAGGLLIAHSSNCPDGWSVDPTDATG